MEEEEDKSREDVHVSNWYIAESGGIPELYTKENCYDERSSRIGSIVKISNKEPKSKNELNIKEIRKNEILLTNESKRFILRKKRKCKEFKIPFREKINPTFIESRAEKKLLKLLDSNDRNKYKKYWKKSTIKRLLKKAFKKGTRKFKLF